VWRAIDDGFALLWLIDRRPASSIRLGLLEDCLFPSFASFDSFGDAIQNLLARSARTYLLDKYVGVLD
jgi:hypothetical protein